MFKNVSSLDITLISIRESVSVMPGSQEVHSLYRNLYNSATVYTVIETCEMLKPTR